MVKLAEIESFMKQYCAEMEGVRRTMFGADGRDGLVGDVAENTHTIRDIQEKQAWWNRGLIGLQALVASIAVYFGNKA